MTEENKRCAFICSRDTIEGIYPSLVLAINAVRLGYDTTIFHTFLGLNAIRKGRAKKAKFHLPGFLGAIPGMTYLSTFMMKRQITKARIDSVEEMQEMAQLEGVKLVACKMTIDMMGIDESEFLDGVEVMTAEEFLKYAPEAQVAMFT